MKFWKQLKEKNNIEADGVVGNWDLITKLILRCSPYEAVKWIVERIQEHFWIKKRKSYLSSEKRVLTNPYIYETISGIKESDKDTEKIIRQLKKKDIDEIKNYWKNKYLFIENWTRFCLLASIACSLFVFYLGQAEWKGWLIVIAAVGLLRVFEIVIRQIRVILFDTVGKHAVSLKSSRRSIILLFYNIVEMIFWFSCSFMVVYLTASGNGQDVEGYLFEKYNFGQFVACSTLQFLTYGDGYTAIGQNIVHNEWLLSITFFEIMVGFIIVLVAFARLFGLLPDVTVQEEK